MLSGLSVIFTVGNILSLSKIISLIYPVSSIPSILILSNFSFTFLIRLSSAIDDIYSSPTLVLDSVPRLNSSTIRSFVLSLFLISPRFLLYDSVNASFGPTSETSEFVSFIPRSRLARVSTIKYFSLTIIIVKPWNMFLITSS